MGAEHQRTFKNIELVRKMSANGIPKTSIAKIIGISVDTLDKHYGHEIRTAHPEHINKIANKAAELALEGNDKMISLILKTQGARYGFVEKQVIEQQDSKAMEELASKVKALEKDAEADY